MLMLMQMQKMEGQSGERKYYSLLYPRREYPNIVCFLRKANKKHFSRGGKKNYLTEQRHGHTSVFTWFPFSSLERRTIML